MMGGPGLDRAGCVLRGLHTAIVDEADSILIDEAVTPLIIASEHKNDLLREAVLRARWITTRTAGSRRWN